MCLETDRKRSSIAKHPITVYKHVSRIGDRFVSSYQRVNVEFGITMYSKLELIREFGTVEFGLHSYVEEPIANVEAQYWDEVLVECIIPAGARYFLGVFDSIHGDAKSYASDELIYTRILKDYTV